MRRGPSNCDSKQYTPLQSYQQNDPNFNRDLSIVQPVKPAHIQFEMQLAMTAKKGSATSVNMSPDLRANMDPRLDNMSTTLGFGNVINDRGGSEHEEQPNDLPLVVRNAISQEMQYSEMPL